MTRKQRAVCIALLGALAWPSATLAADRIDYGKREYMTKCAACHGESGKGDGPRAAQMRLKPTDLTTLSKINGGVFPSDRAYRIIDGRQSVKGHEAPNMPVWSSNFLAEGKAEFAYTTDMPNDLDVHVRNRILSLVDYLDRIQVK